MRVADVELAQALRAFPRQALHACRLAFKHPITSALVIVEAPVPPDMRALLGACGLEGAPVDADHRIRTRTEY
jgi:23S rRNA pseudouridine1911/1915/1917 synthase